jgi:hypothetical protein
MDPQGTSHTVLPDTTMQSASGVTTPDLVAEEKAQQHHEQDFGDQPTLPQDDSPVVKEDYPTGMQLVPILVSTLCAVFLVSLDMTIIGTAIPKITDEFNGLDSVSWVSVFYTYASRLHVAALTISSTAPHTS